MATVSSHAQRAAQRRDERTVKGPDDHKPVAARKDTKRWCRGKVGVPHDPSVVGPMWPRVSRPAWSQPLTRCCAHCGKRIETWFPNWWRNKVASVAELDPQPPTWAMEWIKAQEGKTP